MYNVKLLNKIAECGLNNFDKSLYTFGEDIDNPHAVLVRSASMHEYTPGDNLLAVARAGAGVNNIPIEKFTEMGIAVFNTPGANANAVKELVIAALLLSSRKIVDGINWAGGLTGEDVAKQVEKGKSAFVGPEIHGKKLGVIGLGAIGVMVCNTATHLGMTVMGYDPYITVDGAWGLNHHIKRVKELSEIFEECDYITVHVPSTKETKGMFNSAVFATMKDGVRILNLARADLVNTADMLSALEDGKVACYVTDFPIPELIGAKNVIAIPHLGASTPESEDNCAVMAVDEIREYLENGNIKNSVNLPTIVSPRTTDTRICIIHKNIPAMVSSFSGICADKGVNIDNMINRSRNDVAYTIIETDGGRAENILSEISAVDGVIRAFIV